MAEKRGTVQEDAEEAKKRCAQTGYIGETYVIAKLIHDFSIFSVKLPGQYFAYDLITSNNKRLEVKTAVKRHAKEKRKGRSPFHDKWTFRRNRAQMGNEKSQFVICVCYENKNFSDTPTCFIIPTETLQGKSETFHLTADPKKPNPMYHEYREKWELITG